VIVSDDRLHRAVSADGTEIAGHHHPSTHYVSSADGTGLAIEVTGNGPIDVVCLPGVALPVDLMWDDPGCVRFRGRLEAFSRVIWFEATGRGASEGDPVAGMVGEIFDADLEAVLDAAGSERAAVLGFGNFGPNAIHFAVTHPERVAALVLFNTYAHYVREEGYPWGLRAELLARFVADAKARWGSDAIVEVVAPSRWNDDRFREWWKRVSRLGSGPDEFARTVRASFEIDVRSLLSAVTVPVLVLHREADSYIRAGAGRYLAEHIDGAKFVVLPGGDHLFFVGDTDALADEIEEFLTGRHQAPEGDVVLSTVLFTDIVDSTPQAARLGHRAWSQLSGDHDALVRDALHRHGGREIKTIGDGFLATFDGGTRAVRCATEIVTRAKAIGLDVRAGLHTGEIEVRGNDVAGLSVTIAKRVCDKAGATQVFISETTKGVLAGSGIPVIDIGSHVLKGIPDEWRLFTIEPSNQRT
jgi:class 3 adenylate cyclase